MVGVRLFKVGVVIWPVNRKSIGNSPSERSALAVRASETGTCHFRSPAGGAMSPEIQLSGRLSQRGLAWASLAVGFLFGLPKSP